jgi:T-complex protein 1 subunit gamma
VLFIEVCCTIRSDALKPACAAQVERNLHDAMGVARNVMVDPRLVPGGGAVEMAISRGLYERSATLQGTQQVIVSYLSASHHL